MPPAMFVNPKSVTLALDSSQRIQNDRAVIRQLYFKEGPLGLSKRQFYKKCQEPAFIVANDLTQARGRRFIEESIKRDREMNVSAARQFAYHKSKPQGAKLKISRSQKKKIKRAWKIAKKKEVSMHQFATAQCDKYNCSENTIKKVLKWNKKNNPNGDVSRRRGKIIHKLKDHEKKMRRRFAKYYDWTNTGIFFF